jgi:hypothetical protein
MRQPPVASGTFLDEAIRLDMKIVVAQAGFQSPLDKERGSHQAVAETGATNVDYLSRHVVNDHRLTGSRIDVTGCRITIGPVYGSDPATAVHRLANLLSCPAPLDHLSLDFRVGPETLVGCTGRHWRRIAPRPSLARSEFLCGDRNASR